MISDPAVTVFTSSSVPLNKRFLVAEGTIRKETRASLSAGTAQTMPAPDAEALSALLSGLTPLQALSTGRLKSGDQARITTARRAGEGAIARTLDNFAFPPAPGWLLWDYDDKTMPPEVRDRVDDVGGPLEALLHIWPEARAGEYAVFPSSSDGVTAPGIEALRSNGRHGYFLLEDISKAKDALEALQARAWEAGFAWFALSKSGAVLERSIIDTAVGSPERLIFEAAPELVAPVCRQAHPPIIHRGSALDCPSAPDVAAKREAAREAIKPEAKAAEEAFVEAQAKRVADETGTGIEAARGIVRRRLKGKLLYDDDVIFGPGGSPILVGELLDMRPHGQGMPDPDEGPEYGLTTATFLWGEEYPEPRLVSHAHGQRRVFRFARFMTQGDIDAAESGAEQLRLPAPADLPNGRQETLAKALSGAEKADALPVAVAVAHRLQNRVPARMDVDQVMMFVMDNLPSNTLVKPEQQALRGRVDFIVNKRKSAAVGRISLPGNVRQRHHVEQRKTLKGLEVHDLEGVLVVKAPMGAGKTQEVGRPFLDAARKSGRTAMAVCHRITLTAELARRMDLPNYQDAGIDDIARGVAVCLPSITRPDIAEALPSPDAIFIDEIAQVLQFLTSDMCSGKGGGNRAVHDHLCKIVGSARAVVVADAHVDARTISFLEKCRPREQFRIIEVEPGPCGKRAEVFGYDDGPVIDGVARELAQGGKVWLACEGKNKAESLAALFKRENYRVMCVTSHTKQEDLTRRFLEDADEMSREFDLVVSSPAISSGLSIEHRAGAHFTLGAFVGSGTQIRPEDAMQQLGRVRYLQRFMIGVKPSNLIGGLSEKAIRQGIEDAARMDLQADGGDGYDDCPHWTSFDTFKAGVVAEAHNAQADFAAGLWWLLERDGWALERRDDQGSSQTREASREHRAARTAALLRAEPVDSHQATLLRGMTRDMAQETRLEAHDIRLEMGQLHLIESSVELWDEGRGRMTRERFEDLIGADVPLPVEAGKPLIDRQFREARRRCYSELFEGIDLQAPLTRPALELILDRIMARPGAHAALGIVGPKYLARKTGPHGQMLPLRRPKQTLREVTDLLKRAGLTARRKLVSARLKTPLLYILGERKMGQTPTRSDGREKALCITAESWTMMTDWLARRETFDIDLALLSEAVETADDQEPEGQTAEIISSADVQWHKAERQAVEAKRRRMDRQQHKTTEQPRAACTGRGAPALRPLQAVPAQCPKRQLVWLPEEERVVVQLSGPASRYRVDADGPRLIWSRYLADRVNKIFSDWENMTFNDPDAWA